MAKILSIANNKGGCGKTMVSKLLADYAGIVKGYKTLIIDLDPQANLSRRYITMEIAGEENDEFRPPIHPQYEGEDDWDGRSSSADIWVHGRLFPYPTRFENIDIVPAEGQMLAEIELVRKKDVENKIVRFLSDVIYGTDTDKDYDLIIFDTRPSKGPLTSAALFTATHLLMPTQLEPPSLDGLFGMLNLMYSLNDLRTNGDIKLLGILANQFNHQATIHREHWNFIRDTEEVGEYVMDQTLSNWVAYKESMMQDAPSIFNMSKSSKVYVQASAVCEEILTRMGIESDNG